MSSLVIIMIHVIKIVVEEQINPSWVGSIYSSLIEIKQANTRKNGSFRYKTILEFGEPVLATYDIALVVPSNECFDNLYKGDINLFRKIVNKSKVVNLTIQLLSKVYEKTIFTKEDIQKIINSYMDF